MAGAQVRETGLAGAHVSYARQAGGGGRWLGKVAGAGGWVRWLGQVAGAGGWGRWRCIKWLGQDRLGTGLAGVQPRETRCRDTLGTG